MIVCDIGVELTPDATLDPMVVRAVRRKEVQVGPLGIVIAGANVHDAKLLKRTLQAMVVPKPRPTSRKKQPLCLDKWNDNPTGHAAARCRDHTPHIRRIGVEKLDGRGHTRHPARRRVVERMLAWLSKGPAILIRYDKNPSDYRGLIQLACALLWYWRLSVLR